MADVLSITYENITHPVPRLEGAILDTVVRGLFGIDPTASFVYQARDTSKSFVNLPPITKNGAKHAFPHYDLVLLQHVIPAGDDKSAFVTIYCESIVERLPSDMSVDTFCTVVRARFGVSPTTTLQFQTLTTSRTVPIDHVTTYGGNYKLITIPSSPPSPSSPTPGPTPTPSGSSTTASEDSHSEAQRQMSSPSLLGGQLRKQALTQQRQPQPHRSHSNNNLPLSAMIPAFGAVSVHPPNPSSVHMQTANTLPHVQGPHSQKVTLQHTCPTPPTTTATTTSTSGSSCTSPPPLPLFLEVTYKNQTTILPKDLPAHIIQTALTGLYDLNESTELKFVPTEQHPHSTTTTVVGAAEAVRGGVFDLFVGPSPARKDTEAASRCNSNNTTQQQQHKQASSHTRHDTSNNSSNHNSQQQHHTQHNRIQPHPPLPPSTITPTTTGGSTSTATTSRGGQHYTRKRTNSSEVSVAEVALLQQQPYYEEPPTLRNSDTPSSTESRSAGEESAAEPTPGWESAEERTARGISIQNASEEESCKINSTSTTRHDDDEQSKSHISNYNAQGGSSDCTAVMSTVVVSTRRRSPTPPCISVLKRITRRRTTYVHPPILFGTAVRKEVYSSHKQLLRGKQYVVLSAFRKVTPSSPSRSPCPLLEQRITDVVPRPESPAPPPDCPPPLPLVLGDSTSTSNTRRTGTDTCEEGNYNVNVDQCLIDDDDSAPPAVDITQQSFGSLQVPGGGSRYNNKFVKQVNEDAQIVTDLHLTIPSVPVTEIEEDEIPPPQSPPSASTKYTIAATTDGPKETPKGSNVGEAGDTRDPSDLSAIPPPYTATRTHDASPQLRIAIPDDKAHTVTVVQSPTTKDGTLPTPEVAVTLPFVEQAVEGSGSHHSLGGADNHHNEGSLSLSQSVIDDIHSSFHEVESETDEDETRSNPDDLKGFTFGGTEQSPRSSRLEVTRTSDSFLLSRHTSLNSSITRDGDVLSMRGGSWTSTTAHTPGHHKEDGTDASATLRLANWTSSMSNLNRRLSVSNLRDLKHDHTKLGEGGASQPRRLRRASSHVIESPTKKYPKGSMASGTIPGGAKAAFKRRYSHLITQTKTVLNDADAATKPHNLNARPSLSVDFGGGGSTTTAADAIVDVQGGGGGACAKEIPDPSPTQSEPSASALAVDQSLMSPTSVSSTMATAGWDHGYISSGGISLGESLMGLPGSPTLSPSTSEDDVTNVPPVIVTRTPNGTQQQFKAPTPPPLPITTTTTSTTTNGLTTSSTNNDRRGSTGEWRKLQIDDWGLQLIGAGVEKSNLNGTIESTRNQQPSNASFSSDNGSFAMSTTTDGGTPPGLGGQAKGSILQALKHKLNPVESQEELNDGRSSPASGKAFKPGRAVLSVARAKQFAARHVKKRFRFGGENGTSGTAESASGYIAASSGSGVVSVGGSTLNSTLSHKAIAHNLEKGLAIELPATPFTPMPEPDDWTTTPGVLDISNDDFPTDNNGSDRDSNASSETEVIAANSETVSRASAGSKGSRGSGGAASSGSRGSKPTSNPASKKNKHTAVPIPISSSTGSTMSAKSPSTASKSPTGQQRPNSRGGGHSSSHHDMPSPPSGSLSASPPAGGVNNNNNNSSSGSISTGGSAGEGRKRRSNSKLHPISPGGSMTGYSDGSELSIKIPDDNKVLAVFTQDARKEAERNQVLPAQKRVKEKPKVTKMRVSGGSFVSGSAAGDEEEPLSLTTKELEKISKRKEAKSQAIEALKNADRSIRWKWDPHKSYAQDWVVGDNAFIKRHHDGNIGFLFGDTPLTKGVFEWGIKIANHSFIYLGVVDADHFRGYRDKWVHIGTHCWCVGWAAGIMYANGKRAGVARRIKTGQTVWIVADTSNNTVTMTVGKALLCQFKKTPNSVLPVVGIGVANMSYELQFRETHTEPRKKSNVSRGNRRTSNMSSTSKDREPDDGTNLFLKTAPPAARRPSDPSILPQRKK